MTRQRVLPFCFLFTLIIIHASVAAYGQKETRKLNALGTGSIPPIDGLAEDLTWDGANIAKGFYQYEPHNDRAASLETYVQVLYDDEALYIAARMIDSLPGKILTELGLRDSSDEINADQFWVDINPFNDGINGFRFMVSASGVQTDINMSGSGRSHGDINWDAVWLSAVSIDEHGWFVEMKIPYAALRFPPGDVQQWSINFWREIRRTREKSSWNFANRKVGNPLAYMGVLNGIEGVDPPLRLALFPYVSSYLEKIGGGEQWENSFSGGMDLKYGISNSFTMDMTLIPDFGQVQSDARVLNLSPYEVKYDENRQFFTEGTELFGKADIFYSRRIGSRPRGYADVYSGIQQTSEVYEVVIENPLEARLINATKISGRTSSGLGLGLFNAMTAPGHALIRDTISGTIRRQTTQPFTNYSVLVADQSLQNNSFVSLINTNVAGSQPGYTANVSAAEFRLMDATNMYSISGDAGISQQYQSRDDDIFGYTYNLSAGKVGGIWQYAYNRLVYSNTYDPNDLGFLAYNNLVMDKVSLSYNVFDPFWRFLDLRNEVVVNYNRLHTPDTFTGFNIGYRLRALFDNRFFIMARANYRPLGNRDYFEPRVHGRFYETQSAYDLFGMFSTDYRKRVFVDGDISYARTLSYYQQQESGFEFRPTFRASDRLNVSYGFRHNGLNNDIGFVRLAGDDQIYFGMRNTDTYVNTLQASWIFNNNLSLKMDLRHYWSVVEYAGNYYLLNTKGRLDDLNFDLEADNINYNAFTVDMMLIWHFAPGSQLSLAWKNNIDSNITHITRSYWDNFTNIIEQPQINSLSLRILYYLDYQKLRNIVG